jgi:hypothetical protein
MNIGLSTMTKNQGCRLKEWVTYHKNLGHNKFIIFLDNCTDNSEEVLTELKSTGIDIDFFLTKSFELGIPDAEWVRKSHKMYDFVLKNYSHLDWISFIEVDEFIFPQKEDFSFREFLLKINTNCLYINSWDFKAPFDETKEILGQSYHVWTDSQRYHSSYKWRGKSVIKPTEFIECVDAHHFRQKNNEVSSELKCEHENYIQKFYGNEVVMDDTLLRIYHFRNHTESSLNEYQEIKY